MTSLTFSHTALTKTLPQINAYQVQTAAAVLTAFGASVFVLATLASAYLAG